MSAHTVERRKPVPADGHIFRALLEVSPLAIVTLDLDGRVTGWNPAAERLLGWTADEITERLHPVASAEADWLQQRCAEAVQDGRLAMGECQRPRSDGTMANLSLSAAVARDADGMAQGFVAWYTEQEPAHGCDVSAHKFLEEQLREAQRPGGIGQLAAGIAHEINTPSQFVGDNLQFLREALASSGEIFSAIGRLRGQLAAGADASTIRAEIEGLCQAAERADLDYLMTEVPKAIAQSIDGVHRVSRIVNAMKEFSHPQGGVREAIDFNRAVETTMLVAQNELKYVAETHTDFDRELPAVWCLPGEINEVVLGLLTNAAHAISEAARTRPGRGQITVSTQGMEDWVELRVTDTGTGIPEDAQPHVFEPLFTTRATGHGVGQGLALAHAVVVNRHRGRIWFETEVGKGTTFYVRLPLRRRAAAA